MENKLKQLKNELFEESNINKELIAKLEIYNSKLNESESALIAVNSKLENFTRLNDGLNADKLKVWML
jgi:hypothetical protein